jgi:tripartite-type tricarboxylate transporter receptor subunit TctC
MAKASVNLTHVPYRGSGAAITDLLGGQAQVYFVTTPASNEYIRAGMLRPLAVTTETRLEFGRRRRPSGLPYFADILLMPPQTAAVGHNQTHATQQALLDGWRGWGN